MSDVALDLTAARARLAGAVATFALKDPVPSPCVSVCRMDAGRVLCVGCLRTIPEISAWSRMTDDDKRAVWARIEQRLVETTP